MSLRSFRYALEDILAPKMPPLKLMMARLICFLDARAGSFTYADTFFVP